MSAGLRVLPTVRAAAAVPRFAGEVPAIRRRGGPGQDAGAADGSGSSGARLAGGSHAALAADVSGARGLAAEGVSERPARALPRLQRSEAPRDVAQRLDDAVWLLQERGRRLPVPGRGIPVHRGGRAHDVYAAPMAVPDEPQSLSGAGIVSVHGRRDESGEHRARLGQGAVGGQARGAGDGTPGGVRPARVRVHSGARGR